MLVVPIEMTFDHRKVLNNTWVGQKGLSSQKGPSLFGPIKPNLG
jgi:hypothetical protein